MSFVLDASAALAWAFERIHPDEAAYAVALLDRMAEEEALVPELWHLEVVNALAVAERRGVIEMARAADFLMRLDALPIRTASATVVARKEQLFGLAREHGLSAYDASYLDLAIRTGSPLATFDQRLLRACERAGVARA